MLFTNTTQFAVLALLLVIGWLFGLASHPGGKKWKRLYREEQTARSREVSERDATIRELEERNKALSATVPQRDGVSPAVAAAPVPAAAPVAATREPSGKRGWFDWASNDDLTRLRGVDGALARLLNREGVASFADLANLSDGDELALERRIDLPAGFIARERLREQARLLAEGRGDEHARSFG